MRKLFFNFIHTLVTKAPVTIVLVCIALAGLLGTYGALNMELIADQDKLLSEELEYHGRYMKFIERFGDLEFLYILIEGGNREDKIAFATDLAKRLNQSDEIKNVFYKLDTSWARQYALLYASMEELNDLQNELSSNKSRIDELAGIRNVDHILQDVSQSLDAGATGGDLSRIGKLDSLIAAMKGEYESPFAEFYAFEEQVEEETQSTEYFWSDNQNDLLMFVMPQKDFATLSVIEAPLERIRMDIQLTEMSYPNVTAGLTGRPALQADEMSTTNQDMQNASVFALVGVTVLFVIFFRELGRPILAMVALLFAMGWTFGIVALTLGHLNLLSSVFALVLIGLGVDFGIHFLHRYQEELRNSGEARTAVHGALHNAGSGILTGAVTSSVAFLLALMTDFQGLAELGYVAGIGILFCLVAMLMALSAMLMTYDVYVQRLKHIPSPLHIAGLRNISKKPWMLFAVVLVVSLAMIPNALQVRFNDNLLDLQAEGLESVEYEHKLMDSSEYSTWYCAFIREDLQQARQLVEALQNEPLVANVDSVTSVLPEQMDAKREKLQTIHTLLAGDFLTEDVYQPNPFVYQNLRGKLNGVLNQAEQARQRLEQAGDIPAEQRQQMQGRIPNEETLNTLRELRTQLTGEDEAVEQRLARANNELIVKPKNALYTIKQYAANQSVSIDELPQIFHDLYISDDGAYLVMAFPKGNIWEQKAMKKFVGAMRDIDPEVTGTPIQVYESGLLMRNSFQTIGLYSILAVAVLVFLDFRSFKALFFVMTPLLMGVLWLLEIMGTLQVNLNMANFFAIPILIGIGVDNAVHLYHRYEESFDIDEALKTTGTTLTLTSLTTGVGFGSLMMASHQGLASLGQLMAIGTFTCWFSCVVFMPLLIKIFRGQKQTP